MHVTGMLSISVQAANESKSPGTTTCASLSSFTAWHISWFLIFSQQLPWQFIQAAMLRLEGPSEATQPTSSLRPGPFAPCLPGRNGVFPPHPPARPVCYVQSVMGKWVAARGESSPFTSTSGRVNWKEPPLPVEHHRPGLMRRVLLRHLYTPWVPLTAWNRYSWSSGACPIMFPCHSAQQVPPLPAAAAMLELSSGEGCLIPGGMGGCGWLPPAPQVHWALPHHSTLSTFSVRSLQ